MENAAKAALIAGAVLVVISIISVAMYVYSKSADTSKQFGAYLDSTTIKLHNGSFASYEGQSVPYGRAKEVILAVLTNNTKSTTPDELMMSVTIGTKTSNGVRVLCNAHTNQTTAVQLQRLIDSVDPAVAGVSVGGCELLNSREFKYDIEPIYAGNGLLNQIRIYKLI